MKKKKKQYYTLTATEGLLLQNSCQLSVVGCQTNSNTKIQQLTTINQQQKLLKKIRKQQALIENLKTLPFYTVFNQRTQQEKDIAKAEKKLHSLQAQYSVNSRSEQYSARVIGAE
ncbi:hypothetical protein [Flavobacterium suzhouense]|uniref:Uncharacterized protein n=1 Tax=Flavobacterium suzhouense TaxID=1529638 RepID=A0ABW5NQ12_9FLAO